ncbi:metallophosphoesterase family protein [Burkholderia oklahomensis]|uniref:metallophosphoesterase family protein n=1 Tax=Burkholderia oklahomensis TaxID=342113 RepID=UPI00264EF2DA|nr:metallophosphoesterase family protein [Burkholderia oklahomensis]MDN7674837.1 metallophosphoesterase family protein [Burkholderia oklahomensis]
MRVFAVSDLHVEYPENARWVEALSRYEHTRDVLILAGDVATDPARIARVFDALAARFEAVVFVPGNHDLWLGPHDAVATSIDKWHALRELARGAACASIRFMRAASRSCRSSPGTTTASANPRTTCGKCGATIIGACGRTT